MEGARPLKSARTVNPLIVGSRGDSVSDRVRVDQGLIFPMGIFNICTLSQIVKRFYMGWHAQIAIRENYSTPEGNILNESWLSFKTKLIK